MKLLIDADFVTYKACAAAEDEINFTEDVILVVSRFSEALANIRRELAKVKQEFIWDNPEIILFYSDHRNFRKKIYPDYKGHRNRKKPCGYKRCIRELGNEYEVVVMDWLEADDALGIYATQHPGNIIVSPDKDMRQIAGRLYDFKELTLITPEEGEQWHYIQTLAGDQTDGYSGAPGYGVKTAVKLFENEGYKWETIVEAFNSKGLGEDEALLNARLAKILQKEDYDFQQRQPIYWNPTDASSRADDGAAVQDGSD
jgi:DNA polymerase-1